MKQFLMVLMVTLISLSGFSQEKQNYIQDGIFYTTLESGVGEQVPIKLSLSSDFLDRITTTEVFKKWKDETFSNPKNAAYIERWKNQTDVETYLMGSVGMASFYAKWELKNRDSYTPVNGKGLVYINSKNEVCISFPIKGQNGYGNMIFATAFYIEKIIDDKRDNTHFVSSN
jgi:hypothetical protein